MSLTSIVFGLVPWMLFACFVVFIVVTTMVVQARNAHSSTGAPKPSIAGWLGLTFLGGGIWAAITGGSTFMLGMGHSGSSGGFWIEFLLFSGPALYLYIGYRKIEELRSAEQLDNQSDA